VDARTGKSDALREKIRTIPRPALAAARRLPGLERLSPAMLALAVGIGLAKANGREWPRLATIRRRCSMAKTTVPVAVERPERALAHPIGTAWPFDSMIRWADEMDRMFENIGFGRGLFPVTFRKELKEAWWRPTVEVFEKGGEFFVRAELPGLHKENVTVEIEDELLTIRGERKHEKEENKEYWYRSERLYGSFYRTIPLPEGVKTENAKATFTGGVLEITMPVPTVPEKRARRLEIHELPVKETVNVAA
jgi:HSP20 family protein